LIDLASLGLLKIIAKMELKFAKSFSVKKYAGWSENKYH
jgi:hypothetical protein